MIKNTALYASIFIVIMSCGKKSPIQGKDLKGKDALEYLVKEDGKTWELESGHDYYEYLSFNTNGKCIYQNGTKLPYVLTDNNLLIIDFKDFNYTIIEVDNDKFKMILPGHDTLTYKISEKKLEEGKNIAKPIDAKWLKGKYGTTWKFVEGDKTYSFMNDGTIIDAKLLTKVDNWSMEGNVLNFGPNKLTVLKLSPVFFDYDVYGMTIKLNYVCEANKDGSPRN